MYFTNKIDITPDVDIRTSRPAPSHAFGKVLHFLTAGLASPTEQKLAFTAVSILQDINRALRKMGITNIVRLAKDGHDFYFDKFGKENDMSSAMQTFRMNNDDLDSELFNSLYLVVEHESAGLKYLIEADITRSPHLHQSPIVISVNAIVTDFKPGLGESDNEVKEKLKPVFESNESYNNYVIQKYALFESFVDNLQHSIRSSFKIKTLSTTQKKRIVRRASSNKYTPRNRKGSALVHQGYYGYDDFSYYTWYWSDLCYDHHIYITDTELVGDDESVLWSVGNEGLQAEESVFFDSQQDYASIEQQSESSNQSTVSNNAVSEVADSGESWLSDILGDSGDSIGDNQSSCSSCSSCGGS